jgi:MoxR-like ATPase
MKKPAYDEAAKAQLCADLAQHYGTDVVTTKQVSEYTKSRGLPWPYFLANDQHKAGWGKYRVVMNPKDVKQVATVQEAVEVVLVASQTKTLTDDFVPEKAPGYVAFGFYNDLFGIVASRIFYPVYITGLSGNGKTYMVDQVCAQAKRELIRVNITKETDEHDLIGTYELIDGNTVWRDGPVLIAMKRGAVLLLDETDYGSERLLCLQPVLEGKGYFNKKKGEFVTPATGFNVIATANTKGKGSDDGRFIGANVLNEAFLERFAITVEQEYPNEATERRILEKVFAELAVTPGMKATEFAGNLAKWAELIRKSFANGTIDEVISTRRLTHIARAYSIFKNRRKAIELCLNRFDTETKKVYLDFYTKIDANIDAKIVEPDSQEFVIPGAKPASKAPPTAEQVEAARAAALVAARKAATSATQQDVDDAIKAPLMGKTATETLANQHGFTHQPSAIPVTRAPHSRDFTRVDATTLSQAKPVTDPGMVRDIMQVCADLKTKIVVRQTDTGDLIVASHGNACILPALTNLNKMNFIQAIKEAVADNESAF